MNKSSMRIKVEPYLMPKGNRVAKAAIEFTDGVLEGFHLVGFTICNDAEKGLFILFPASIVKKSETDKPFFFLRPSKPDQLKQLETEILDVYESMVPDEEPFNGLPVSAIVEEKK